MKYCPSCGKEVVEGAKFCGNCGSPVSQQIQQPIIPQQPTQPPITQPMPIQLPQQYYQPSQQVGLEKKPIVWIIIGVIVVVAIFFVLFILTGTQQQTVVQSTPHKEKLRLGVSIWNRNDSAILRVDVYIDHILKGKYVIQPHSAGGGIFGVEKGSHTITVTPCDEQGHPIPSRSQSQTINVSGSTTITFYFD
ncbi:MAG: zinc ribbon domain-containing protein [Candidatus Thermoplasmatota archaeon]